MCTPHLARLKSPLSLRTGVIGRKICRVASWDDDGGFRGNELLPNCSPLRPSEAQTKSGFPGCQSRCRCGGDGGLWNLWEMSTPFIVSLPSTGLYKPLRIIVLNRADTSRLEHWSIFPFCCCCCWCSLVVLNGIVLLRLFLLECVLLFSRGNALVSPIFSSCFIAFTIFFVFTWDM